MTLHPQIFQHVSPKRRDIFPINNNTNIIPTKNSKNSLISPKTHFIFKFLNCPKNIFYSCFSESRIDHCPGSRGCLPSSARGSVTSTSASFVAAPSLTLTLLPTSSERLRLLWACLDNPHLKSLNLSLLQIF